MKSAHLVVGVVLTIMGGLFLAGAVVTLGETCSTDSAAAALLGVSTCSSVAALSAAWAIVGIIFFVVSGIVLFVGRAKGQPIMPVAAPIPQSPAMTSPIETQVVPRFCSTCGNPVSPGSRYCSKCGAKL